MMLFILSFYSIAKDIIHSFDINKGLRMGRALMTEITHMGMPVSTELLDTISPQYTSDLISWGAIGARTTESQIHRELASGCSFPVGFKNGTDGNLSIIYDGIRAASSPHHFLGINKEGNACIMHTMGNSDCHVILRGGSSGPNYDAKHVQQVKNQLEKQNLNTISIMIDCSHGNSCGNYKNQSKVVESVADQVSHGEYAIKSVMIESNLKEGKQTMPEDGLIGLEYGISITDSCIGWEETEHLLETLAKAVQARRRRQ
jgi:3-deoxy-7-phosphoheptulonate synthase